MNKKNIRTIIISTILAMQFGVGVEAKDTEETLYKFGTENSIMLHDEEIKVPTNFEDTKTQFRSAWVSTVANIDFPSKETLKDGKITKEEYIADFNKILDRSQELNLNALIVQVSPMLDAWYKSDINPWSQYLSGKQGVDPEYGDWDSMKWMIEETHKRGLEFHAWFNPYRVTNNPKDDRSKEDKLGELSKENFAVKNPELVYEFESKLYLDPGRPEVIKHVIDTVEEVINKYDIDAVHFDDYFYPYQYASKTKGNENPPDKATFEKYADGEKEIDKWRMENINKMIKSVNETISGYNKKNKKGIEFGVSPFGIWGHAQETEGVGSHTPVGATSSYRDYVDSIKWAKEGWVDYLIPQIYWSFSNTSAPYGELADWWGTQFAEIKESHLYIGHANYKYLNDSQDNDWNNVNEIGSQLKFNQKYDGIKGDAFFSFKNIINYSDGEKAGSDISNKSIENIKNEYYKWPVNIPAKPWLDNVDTNKVEDLEISEKDSKIELQWNDNNEDTRFYVIYRMDSKENKDEICNPKNIIARIGKEAGMSFIDENLEKNNKYYYGVTIIDEAGNETEAECIESSDEINKENISLGVPLIGLILGGTLLVACCILGIILVGFL